MVFSLRPSKFRIDLLSAVQGKLICLFRYIFDLGLPNDFTPTPKDGEVDCFYLWDMDQVKKTILNGEWKPNCALGK